MERKSNSEIRLRVSVNPSLLHPGVAAVGGLNSISGTESGIRVTVNCVPSQIPMMCHGPPQM